MNPHRTSTHESQCGSLPKGWRFVRFDELAHMVNERVDPSATDAEIYVGLEHLDSESFKIRRWGTPADVIGQKLGFRKGDIIFGRRRAYQRKLAVADFDGICSAHAMVLRAKSETVNPEFLPFLMQSDLFMQRAIDISVGSLSPTINWKTLRIQEFPLPPKNEQRRIAEILWAADEVSEQFARALQAFHQCRHSYTTDFFCAADLHDATRHNDWRILSGQELLDNGYLTALQDGNHGGQYPRSNEFGPDGLPYLSAAFISDQGDIDLLGCPRLPIERASKLRIPPARGGDVILTNNATVGRVAILPCDCGEVVASTSTTYYRVGNGLNRNYLAEYLRSATFQQQLSRVMVQSTRHQVPITTQKKLLFVVPPIGEQIAFASKLESMSAHQKVLDTYCGALGSLKSLLSNELLSEGRYVH